MAEAEAKLGQNFLKRIIGALDTSGVRKSGAAARDLAHSKAVSEGADLAGGLAGGLNAEEKTAADVLLKKHGIKTEDDDYAKSIGDLNTKLNDKDYGKGGFNGIKNTASDTADWLTASDRKGLGASRAKAVAIRGGAVAGGAFIGGEALNGIRSSLSGNSNSDIGGRPY